MLFFFFFQAEDGIRDKLVTGVQTCALPILAGRNTPMSLLQIRLPNVTIHGEISDAVEFISRHSIMVVPLFSRSEERRVGKECRSRWSRHHEKKKQTKDRVDHRRRHTSETCE